MRRLGRQGYGPLGRGRPLFLHLKFAFCAVVAATFNVLGSFGCKVFSNFGCRDVMTVLVGCLQVDGAWKEAVKSEHSAP